MTMEYKQKIVLKRTGDSAFEIGDSDEYLSRPHMCETCGKRFTLLENLNRHQMIHTDQRPYVCNYCNKRFRLAQHLKEHVRIHTGEKPYKCPTCGRAFCQISNLKSHQKTHTKIKAFKCEICEKSFRRSFTLKQHRLTHTRRSFSGPIGDTANELRSPDRKKICRKLSAPTPTISHHNDITMAGRSVMTQALQNALPRFPVNHLSYFGEFRGHPTATSPSERPVPPLISFAPEAAPPIKQEFTVPSTSHDTHFPSLSALLRTDGENNTSIPPSMLRNHQSMYPPTVLSKSGERERPLPIVYSATTISDATVNKQSYDISNNGASDTSCIQCERKFRTGNELRDHVINHHSRKDQRRDSAYSSHSDKSLPSSPNNKKSLSAPTSNHDVTSMTSQAKFMVESVFMQRVKELALKSLEKSEHKIDDDITISPPTSQCADDKVTEEDVDCPDVGHSPTEAFEKPTENKDENSLRKDDHEGERKFIKRAVGGPQKWKRQLCKEWYEVPTVTNDNTMQQHDNDTQLQKEARDTSDKHVTKETSDPTVMPRSGDINATGPQQTPVAFDFSRFTPIVEWKPVVTGWRDTIFGTMYPIPPHMQQNIFGVTTPMIDPRYLYEQAASSLNNSASKSATSSLETLSGEIKPQIPDTSARHFRFSPHTIQNFATHGAETITPSATPESGSSGVYSHFYPREPLPISGYSRLQHALLYEWDPNRERLGGISSVPQSANLVPAN